MVGNLNTRYLVLKLYEVLQPRPDIVRDRYRNLLTSFQKVRRSSSGNESTVDISEDAADEGIVVRNYQGAHEARIEVSTGSGQLPEDSIGRPLAMRAFVVESSGLFRSEAPVAQLFGGRDSHHMFTGSFRLRVIKYRRLKPYSVDAERGEFPLLYPYGDVHTPYDTAIYIEARDASRERGRRTREVNEKLLTWAEHYKRQLYTDNILINSGTLLQQWLLRTNTNFEDPILRYLENEQMIMVEERGLQQGTHTGTDEIGPPGKLYLPGNHKNSTAYWRQKRLDVQAMVARLGSPALFITVKMNVWREEMRRLWMDNENTGAFAPQGDRCRPFDRPDLIARVYNQYSNSIMKDLQNKSEEIFGLKCLGVAAKLEFQERNTPHHHIRTLARRGAHCGP